MSEANARPLGNAHFQNLVDQTGKMVPVSSIATASDLAEQREQIEGGIGKIDVLSQGTNTARGLNFRFAERANPKDWGAIGDGVVRRLSDAYADIESAREAFPGVYIDDMSKTVDWAAIQAAVATGLAVWIPKGNYPVNEEIEVVTAGQCIEFANLGGYGYGEDIGAEWEGNTRIIAVDGFSRRIRTRRKHRANASSAQDDPLSVVFNIQAESVWLSRPCIWLDVDYSDTSPANYGADVDVGIFIGTRCGVQIHDPQVIGYFRKVGIYFDVSGQTGLPRFPSRSGNAYPTGTVENGADGCAVYNPYTRGPRIGLGILGALPAQGYTTYGPDYYDELSGQLVTDVRGAFGASDFLCIQPRLYGPDHHSNQRLQDPSSTTLSATSLANEPDFSPASCYISGLAGNASGSIWSFTFVGGRIATFEMFRLRLDYAARVKLIGTHIEGRNNGRKNTSGVEIDSNNYASATYGDIAATANTRSVTWRGTNRQTPDDGAFNHFYGSDYAMETDSGRYYTSGYISAVKGQLDLRSAAGSSILLRSGTDSIGEMSATAARFLGAGVNTVASPANAFLTAAGTLSRSTSARRYKRDIQALDEELLDRAMQLAAHTYKPSSITSDPDKERRFLGFIAEEAEELGLVELIERNEETGELEGFGYDRMTVVHQMELQRHRKMIKALEDRLSQLEG